MRFTPRLLLMLLALQLWGCAFERNLKMKCVGECTLDVTSSGEAIDPTALPKGP